MTLLRIIALAADLVSDLLGPPPPVATCDEPGAGWLAALALGADNTSNLRSVS